MNCRIVITQEAEKNLTALRNPVILEQVTNRIDVLKNNPETGKPLRGILAGYRSLSAARNRYRIIYRYIKEESLVVIIAIGLRKGKDFADVYKALQRSITTGSRKK